MLRDGSNSIATYMFEKWRCSVPCPLIKSTPLTLGVCGGPRRTSVSHTDSIRGETNDFLIRFKVPNIEMAMLLGRAFASN